MRSILLFSDVDGTLLDEHGRYAVATGELSAMSTLVRCVLASSRTILELSRNQRDLGIEGPVVAENGAVIALPWHDALRPLGTREDIDGRTWCVSFLGAPAAELRGELQEVARDVGVNYEEQGELAPELDRRCSLLVRPVPRASASTLTPLVDALRARGRTVASGGAWLAITGGADKGRGVRAVLSALALLGRPRTLVAAVGDGDNDVSLLLAADRRFVIRRADGTCHASLRALPGVEYAPTPGIDGWRDVWRQLTGIQEA
ncbi:MAG: HAD-IIB family hydrolase [Gemmatimonadetes bacterium]|nr:HAD-IIB family hydrolase [Gemmatimonadota bacterium]